MNWFDLALIGLLGVLVTSGIRKGISRSGLGLLAVVSGFLAASLLFPPYQLGFLIVFVGVICLVGAGAWLLGQWLRKTDQEWLDKLLGGAAGLVNALVLCVIAAVALMAFAPSRRGKWWLHRNSVPTRWTRCRWPRISSRRNGKPASSATARSSGEHSLAGTEGRSRPCRKTKSDQRRYCFSITYF
ncbi:MAG: CvpA family protein [Bryobacterales bacterium]|nr:CvpA family protein [Bryobacterales bacterium]